MRKNQLYYFSYPIIYFILATVGQYVLNADIKWKENLSFTVIAIVILYLSLVITNWANTPPKKRGEKK
ncbi:hypothetical protein MKZ25_15690 [Solibacillus sp. FSL W7-1464]|uniref:hypothetical protein n=1 Tax=unclassified Solibacillus TaxID=2637870 RepID=UPI0030FB1E96